MMSFDVKDALIPRGAPREELYVYVLLLGEPDRAHYCLSGRQPGQLTGVNSWRPILWSQALLQTKGVQQHLVYPREKLQTSSRASTSWSCQIQHQRYETC